MRRKEDKYYKKEIKATKLKKIIEKYFKTKYPNKKKVEGLKVENYIMYFIYNLTSLKYKEIGEFFNIISRQTVYGNIKLIKKKIEQGNIDINKIITEIEKLFKNI